MRRRCLHLPLPAALCLLSPLGCSLLVDLDGLSADGGGVAPGAISFTDDELEGEFGDGAFENTRWAGDHVELTSGISLGHFHSRVFDAAAQATWQTLSWRPDAPYGKALPDQGGREEGYADADIDMAGNVLLLHFDGVGAVLAGQQFEDTSGRGNHAVLKTTDGPPADFTTGRFGQALMDNASTYAAITVGAGSDLQFREGDFTWALWVNFTEDCDGNKVHLGVEDPEVDRTHLWLGCARHNINWGLCPGNATGGRAAGYFTSRHTGGDGGAFCGETVINDGAWHHMAVTKMGHAQASVTLYVDGKVEFTSNDFHFYEPLDLLDNPELAIGGFSNGTYPSVGVFDEVAIWLRALTPAEIASLYRRGALRLSMQVRTCADAACGDAPNFAGPGGDPSASFWDPPGSLAPDATVGLDGPQEGRFFQYKARFESDVPGESPALFAATVTGAR